MWSVLLLYMVNVELIDVVGVGCCYLYMVTVEVVDVVGVVIWSQ